jgi:hypothetical protein
MSDWALIDFGRGEGLYAAEMSQWITTIISRLTNVRALRRERDADPNLGAKVQAVKQFQHARFVRDYTDLLTSSRYRAAAMFFLDELYGPADFSARDAEFERVVPMMARVLPHEVVRTIADLMELHSLTEELDQRMAAALNSAEIDEASYRGAWLQIGRRLDRERQVALLLESGRALDRHTRSKVVLTTLRVMRRPAQAAGYGRLQAFLEAGMSAFARMAGAQDFLRVIEHNEARTIDDLFSEK